jgi:hypothetical protein
VNEPQPPETGFYSLQRLMIQTHEQNPGPIYHVVSSQEALEIFTVSRYHQSHNEYTTKIAMKVLLCPFIIHNSIYSTRSMNLNILICQFNAMGIMLEARFALFPLHDASNSLLLYSFLPRVHKLNSQDSIPL